MATSSQRAAAHRCRQQALVQGTRPADTLRPSLPKAKCLPPRPHAPPQGQCTGGWAPRSKIESAELGVEPPAAMATRPPREGPLGRWTQVERIPELTARQLRSNESVRHHDPQKTVLTSIAAQSQAHVRVSVVRTPLALTSLSGCLVLAAALLLPTARPSPLHGASVACARPFVAPLRLAGPGQACHKVSAPLTCPAEVCHLTIAQPMCFH